MAKGKVKWFNAKKGYGFVSTEEGKDVFVHYKEINTEGFKTLEEGEDVEFEIKSGDKRDQAVNVRKI